MTSTRAQLADAIANALKAADSSLFSQPFAVKRQYVPKAELGTGDLATLTFTVVPSPTQEREAFDRQSIQKQDEIQIGVQKKLSAACDPESPAGNAEIDGLMAVVEQVADYFEPTRDPVTPLFMDDGSQPKWVSSRINGSYLEEHMRQFRVFTSYLTLTWFYL